MQNVKKDIKRKHYLRVIGIDGRVFLKIIIRSGAGYM
jgi:hypothetical protein